MSTCFFEKIGDISYLCRRIIIEYMKKSLLLSIIALLLTACSYSNASMSPSHDNIKDPFNNGGTLNPDDGDGSWGGDKTGGNHITIPVPTHLLDLINRYTQGKERGLICELWTEQEIITVQLCTNLDEIYSLFGDLPIGIYTLRVYTSEGCKDFVFNLE